MSPEQRQPRLMALPLDGARQLPWRTVLLSSLSFFACIDCLRRCTACACVCVSATLVGEPSTMVMAAERAIDTYIDHESNLL